MALCGMRLCFRIEIQRLLVDMDSIVRDTITHPTISISVHGSPVVTNGIIGNAVRLNGVGQFIQFDGGDGDLSNYHRGFTLRFKIKPHQLTDNMYWMSGSGFDILYRNSQVIVRVRTTSGLWEASFSGIKEDMWHQVEVSWHSVDGLTLYVNGTAVEQLSSVKYDGVYNGSRNFYIGKAFDETSLVRFANASFDDFQFWKAKRDYLIPDMIDPGWVYLKSFGCDVVLARCGYRVLAVKNESLYTSKALVQFCNLIYW